MLYSLLAAVQVATWLPIIVIIAIIVIVVLKLRYKIVKANEVLVISGGREKKKASSKVQPPSQATDTSALRNEGREKSSVKIMRAGSAFISPFRRADVFSLSVMTIQSEGQITQSSAIVPVTVKWTAQIKADDTTDESLERAVTNFLGFRREDIEEALKQSLDGEVRAVIGTKTPEEIVTDKNSFGKEVRDGVQEKMEELGFRLLSLNIAEVSDSDDYYRNLAAKDREEKRMEAENLTAKANQSVNEQKAESDKASEFAILEKQREVAAKTRDVNVLQAGYDAETAKARKEADYAGQLTEQEKMKELATQLGAVAVERETQNQAAAEQRQKVVMIVAETEKQKRIIESEAEQEAVEIQAEATAAKGKIEAEANAIIAKTTATGNADAKSIEARAEADKIEKIGVANATAIEAEGKAEAAAILEKGKAEAEVQRQMADAMAANNAVNLQVALAEIESRTQIEVSTAVGKVMGEIGSKATFIDMGSGGSENGDLLTGFMSRIPEMMAKANIKSAALNGGTVTDDLNSIASALLNKNPVSGSTVSPLIEQILSAAVPVAVAGTALSIAKDETILSESAEDASEVTNPDIVDETTATEEVIVPDIPANTVAESEENAPEWRPPFDSSREPQVQTEEEPSEVESEEDLIEEAKETLVDFIEEYDLDEEEIEKAAQVYAIIKDSGEHDNEELIDMADKAVQAIKSLHRSGKPVQAKSIAKIMLDKGPDENLEASDIIDALAELSKKVAKRRKRK